MGKKKDRVKIQLLTNISGRAEELETLIDSSKYEINSFPLQRVLDDESFSPQIVIIASKGIKDSEEGFEFCKRLRSHYYEKALQILFIADEEVLISRAIDAGADDFLPTASINQELGSRLHAAFIRFQSQLRLWEERDFFRKAAKQEEELSSRILDQHMILKQAFQNIETINRELEDANKQLEKVARYDMLSGLLNRASLVSAMDVEIERATRSEADLSGIMLDIDNFKEINDSHGHLYGDHVISEIGHRLLQSLRKYDQAGRYGGEEFFIILPDTGIEQAFLIAERFRKELQDNPIMHGGSASVVTASFGIAQFHIGETRTMWLSRADKLMYDAKQSGRNRVIASGE